MAMTTSQQMVDLYIDAEKAVLDGRTVTLGGRTLTMENLQQIRAGRMEWERRAFAESRAASGHRPGPSLATF
jgi:hypothetical protein